MQPISTTTFRKAAVFLTAFALVPRFAGADDSRSRLETEAQSFSYAPGTTSGGVRVAPNSMMLVSGVALDQPVERVFQLRNRRGRVFSVDLGAFSQGWWTLPQDGTLKVYGLWKDGILHATNLKYDDGLYGSRAYSESREEIVVKPATISGTLIADADPYGFDLIDDKGEVHCINTRRFLTLPGTKLFLKGDQVRVHGQHSVVDGVSQLDMGFLVRLSPRRGD